MSDSPFEVGLRISLDKGVDRSNLAMSLGCMVSWWGTIGDRSISGRSDQLIL